MKPERSQVRHPDGRPKEDSDSAILALLMLKARNATLALLLGAAKASLEPAPLQRTV